MATFTLDAVIGAFARVSQAPLEVLVLPSDGAARVSQAPLEVLVLPSDGAARVSQSAVEVLGTPASADIFSRVSQSVAEVLIKQPIVGSKKVDAVLRKTQTGSKTISALIKVTRTFGTRDVTYVYSGPSIVIYADQTKKNPSEQTIPGCDLNLGVAPGAAVTIIWDVWQSHFQWGQDKKEVLRLHRDGVTGLVMMTVDPQGSGTDAGNNNKGDEWEFAGWYREAAHSGRYSLSFLPVKGNSTLYSDSIYFSLQTPGVGPGLTVDAAIVLRRTRSFSVSARLKASGTVVKAATIDAVIRVPRSTSTSIDATLFLWGLGAFVTKAVIGKTSMGSFTLGARIVRNVAAFFTLGALIRNPVAGSFTVGAVVKRLTSSALSVDSVVTRTVSSSLTTNAIVTRPSSGSFGIDAFLKIYSFRIDARIFMPSTGSFSVAAAILGTKGSAFTVVATLARHDAGSMTLDAVIERRSFSLPAAFE
jgi:hypothetical protein